jgi:multidrug resistance protein
MTDSRSDRTDLATAGQSRPQLPPGFFALWSTVAIDLVGFGIVVARQPQYAERLGATPTTIGLLAASFSLAQLVFAPLLGRLSDRIGRKPVLVISLLGTAVGSLLTGLAGSVWMLFAGRLVDGASGASVSVAQAAAADLAPPEQRPRVMGLLGAAFGIGFVVGPAIGALGALGGPAVPFVIAAVLAFVNAVVAIRRLPETSSVGPAAIDAVRLAESPALDGPGLAEPAHLVLTRPNDGSVQLGVGTRRAILRLIVVAFVGMAAFSGFEATFALLGERRFGFGPSATGVTFALIGLALVAVQSSLVGPINRALGESGCLRVGLALNASGLVVLAAGGGYPGLVAALGLLVIGQGLVSPTLSSGVAGRAGARRGQWLGWQQSAAAAARVAGPAAAGALFEHVALGAPYLVGAVLTLMALVLVPA